MQYAYHPSKYLPLKKLNAIAISDSDYFIDPKKGQYICCLHSQYKQLQNSQER